MQSKSNIICIYVIKLYWKRTAKWLLRFLVRINREDEEKCFSLNVWVCVCTHICVYVYWIHCELEFLREIGKFILIKMTPVELESRTAKNRDFFQNKLKLQEKFYFPEYNYHCDHLFYFLWSQFKSDHHLDMFISGK